MYTNVFLPCQVQTLKTYTPENIVFPQYIIESKSVSTYSNYHFEVKGRHEWGRGLYGFEIVVKFEGLKKKPTAVSSRKISREIQNQASEGTKSRSVCGHAGLEDPDSKDCLPLAPQHPSLLFHTRWINSRMFSNKTQIH